MVANQLGSANGDVLQLTSADRAAYLRSRELLDPLGIPLEMAAAQVADLHKQLNGVPPSTVVEFYRKRHPSKAPSRTVQVVVDELLLSKEGDGLSAGYVSQPTDNLQTLPGTGDAEGADELSVDG